MTLRYIKIEPMSVMSTTNNLYKIIYNSLPLKHYKSHKMEDEDRLKLKFIEYANL